MNNKGFMMAEVVVVSAVILVALSVFYVNYNKLISLYNERLSYYDPTTLYKLADYRNTECLDIYKSGSVASKCLVPAGSYSRLSGTGSGNGDTIYIAKGTSLTYIKSNAQNKTFDKYIDYLNSTLDSSVKNNYLLVMESCKSDRTDCKYAYLEVLVRE